MFAALEARREGGENALEARGPSNARACRSHGRDGQSRQGRPDRNVDRILCAVLHEARSSAKLACKRYVSPSPKSATAIHPARHPSTPTDSGASGLRTASNSCPQIGAAVVATFIVGGSSVGVWRLPRHPGINHVGPLLEHVTSLLCVLRLVVDAAG
jgi:hypothetical protein